MNWSYGVTTVPARRHDLLPRTLESLRATGFDRPRLFVDGSVDDDEAGWRNDFGFALTVRAPGVNAYGNWLLALIELYVRSPTADLFALFQDDVIACKNLRQYVERRRFGNEYLNLYTASSNQGRSTSGGWFEAGLLNPGRHDKQSGRGALALVFNRAGVMTLLGQPSTFERIQDPHRGWRSVDGAVVTAMNAAGWREMVHNPSLVQHVGQSSTIRDGGIFSQAPSFPGEGFDAMSLLPCK